MEKVATKRYTKRRVTCILTIFWCRAVEQSLPEGIHVLGFSQRGQDYLKALKHSVNLIEAASVLSLGMS
ncbi:nucleotidyltransferase family protein [Streptococcus sp.]|uniref:nucleotidyltransferase family protein n=1 Tax=Streptococcus sp. TaxID=1306 RepID=UPI00391D8BC8